MKLGIVTDSTADLPGYFIEQHEIQVVPTVLILDGKEYKDGIGISREEFYTRLPSLQTPATTAAPSIGDFVSPYQSLLNSGCDHILSIHVLGKLSGVVNVARRASQEFPGKVTCVDSGSLSMGIGFQVLAAAESAEQRQHEEHEVGSLWVLNRVADPDGRQQQRGGRQRRPQPAAEDRHHEAVEYPERGA